MNIDVHVVPVENGTKLERLTAAAAVYAVSATNETIPEIKQSGQTWR